MNFATDFLSYAGLTVMTLLPIIKPVGTAVLLRGSGAIARIMGFLMICIGVQFVINGVRELVGG